MAAFAVLATVLSPSLAAGATTERTLESWPAIQTLVRFIVLTQQDFATPRRDTRSLADGDTCTTGAPLSIEDKTFDSTGCYIDTPIDGRGSGFLYTETGVEPVEDGTGWDQGVTFAVSMLSSTLQSSSSSENDTTTNVVTNFGASSIGRPTSTDSYSSSSSSASGCEDSGWKSDGECDPGNNNAGCEFDGGDCCECTCVDTPEFTCDDFVFYCIDPSAPCVDDDDGESSSYSSAPSSSSSPPSSSYSLASSTPSSSSSYSSSTYGEIDDTSGNNTANVTMSDGFLSFNFSSSTTEMFWISTYLPPFNGQPLELESMDYVCRSSIVEVGSHPTNTAVWSCAFLEESSGGSSAVFEEMPASLFSTQCGCNNTGSASTSTNDSATGETPTSSSPSPLPSSSSSSGCENSAWKINGKCDPGNNNAECAFDGGDCCACTCVDTPEYTCDDFVFDCIDPSAPCVNDDDGSASSSLSSGCEESGWKSDGECDPGNNNAECEFDGGDCCECTCVDTPELTCDNFIFYCIDPSAPCENIDESSDTSDYSDTRPTKDDTSGVESAGSSADRKTTIDGLVLFICVLGSAVASAV